MKSSAMSLVIHLAMFILVPVAGLLEPSTMDVERVFISEMMFGRLASIEDEIRPIFNALPKGENGHLGHQAVRYAVHRLFAKRRGWFINGLEPSHNAPNPSIAHSKWAPAFLHGLLEERVSERGVDLHGLAAFVAALEDLVRMEADARLEEVYSALGLPTEGDVPLAVTKGAVIIYLMAYLQGGNFAMFYNATNQQVHEMVRVFGSSYASWTELQDWLESRWEHHGGSGNETSNFNSVKLIVEKVGEDFSSFNNYECESLKSKLVSMEEKKAGRVQLKDFYTTGLLSSKWKFTEKVEYLRALGALDETDRERPFVIIPNYLQTRTHCLEVSNIYAICCPNMCEDVMGKLELGIAGPSAPPAQIVELISPSQNISQHLLQRLNDMASGPNQHVQLHSRLFAQWIHHVFPRECPYPHEEGATGPQTPDDWLKEVGEETEASDLEMLHHVGKHVCMSNDGCDFEEVNAELPWTETERLLAPHEHHFPVSSIMHASEKTCTVAFVSLVMVFFFVSFRKLKADGKAQKLI